MTAIPKKFGFIRTTLALWAGNLFPGRAGVVTDAPVGASTSETWGWYDGSAWKYAAKRGGSETFSALSISGLTNGAIPRVSTAGGLLGNSALTQDATYVRSSKPMSIDSTLLRIAPAAGQATLGMDVASGNAAVNVAYTAGSVRWLWGKNSDAESGTNAGSSWHLRAFGDTEALIDTPIAILRAAGGLMTLARPVKVGNGIGVFGVTPPSSRPTVNAACTDLATCIALTNQLRTHLIACGLVQ